MGWNLKWRDEFPEGSDLQLPSIVWNWSDPTVESPRPHFSLGGVRVAPQSTTPIFTTANCAINLSNFKPDCKAYENNLMLQIKKIKSYQIFIILAYYPFGCHEWAVPISAALRQGPQQDCSGGEPLATCVRFDRLEIWTPFLPHQRQTSYHLFHLTVI